MSIRKVFAEKNSPHKKKVKKRTKNIKICNEAAIIQMNNVNNIISPHSHKSSVKDLQIPDINDKCNRMKEQVIKARNDILKNIQETLEYKPDCNDFDKIFHKSMPFIQRKAKIKDNVISHKCKSSAKIEKIKSVVDTKYKDTLGKDFISSDDLSNDEAMIFLNINKRKFGELTKGITVFKEKRKKTVVGYTSANSPSEHLVYSPAALEGRNSSLPEIVSPKLTPDSKHKYITFHDRKSLDLQIKSPTNNYIKSELRKL